MKLIFYQLSQLERYKNIKIKFHHPTSHTKVVDLDSVNTVNTVNTDLHPGNFSIFRNLKSKLIYLYYSTNCTNPFLSKTFLLVSRNGVDFKTLDLEMSKKAFSSNMFTFIDHSCTPKYRYKAIGGCHLSQWHFKELGTKEDQDNVKNLPVINLKSLLNLKNSDMIYDLPHPAFIKRKKNKQDSGIESVNNKDNDTESMFKFLDSTQPDHKYYGNGLYLYTSDDGYNWNIKNERPIISGMKEGHYDYLYFCSTFQSHPNCFYDPFKNEYLLYLRSNLNGGLKHIQVARSINLTDWKPLEFVNFNPTFDLSNDNYESLNPMVYPDISNKHPIYISFPVFHRKKAKTADDSFIGLGFSEDGLNWKMCGDLIKPVLTKDQTSSALVYGLIKSDDGLEFYFYEHRNRSRNIKNQSNSIWKHSIRIDGFTSISAGNVEGFIQTREIEFGAQIQLNYHSKINGYLHLEFMNSTQDVVANQKNIIGDNINYIINVPELLNSKKGYLRMTLKDTEIYSITI